MSAVDPKPADALAGRYTIERELGQGGMATVYLARDTRHERLVALKVLRPELAVSLGAERFLREIKLAAQLQHPHFLPLHDSGEAAGFLYFVMPYVEGESLRGRLSDAMLFPFSLMWGGFAIFWELSVLRDGAPFFFALWGIPFVLLGLYLIFGRFFADAWQRSRTYYGITNERVLIVSGLFQRQVKSLSLRRLPEVTLSERRDRSGTIIFGAAPPMYGRFAGSSWPGMGRQLPPSFEMIENVRQVYGQVQTAQRALDEGIRP